MCLECVEGEPPYMEFPALKVFFFFNPYFYLLNIST
jgi:hypothetical protein